MPLILPIQGTQKWKYKNCSQNDLGLSLDFDFFVYDTGCIKTP